MHCCALLKQSNRNTCRYSSLISSSLVLSKAPGWYSLADADWYKHASPGHVLGASRTNSHLLYPQAVAHEAIDYRKVSLLCPPCCYQYCAMGRRCISQTQKHDLTTIYIDGIWAVVCCVHSSWLPILCVLCSDEHNSQARFGCYWHSADASQCSVCACDADSDC